MGEDKIFSIRLSSAMNENNMKQVDLCNKTGIGKSAMSQYLSGSFAPKNDKIYIIAKALNVNPAWLLGYDVEKHPTLSNIIPLSPMHSVPVLGTIAAGFGKSAIQDIIGYEMTDHGNYQDCFFLKVMGNSMEPRIFEGDFVLIDKAATIDNGNIVAVIVNGEEGTVKRFEKKENAIVLKPLNPSCETRVFIGKEQEDVYIVGRVVEVKAKL